MTTPHRHGMSPERMRALEPIRGALSLSRYEIRDGATVTGKDPLVVETTDRPSDGAIAFRVKTRKLRAVEGGRVLISLTGWVLEGAIGVGLVAKDGSTHVPELCEGPDRGHAGGRLAFDLFPGDPSLCHELVVRNAAGGGRRSRIIIESVAAYTYSEVERDGPLPAAPAP